MNIIKTTATSVALEYAHNGYYPYTHIILAIDVCGSLLPILAVVEKSCNIGVITFIIDTTFLKTGAYKVKLYYSDGTIDLSENKYIQDVTLNLTKKIC